MQYGFQEYKSTEPALTGIKDEVIENIEARFYTLSLFLDFQKAFDKVQHDVLLFKLGQYG